MRLKPRISDASTGSTTNKKEFCEKFDIPYRTMTEWELELADVDVNMFKALNNQLINDGCGLFRGRQILPFEHLSRFQEDNL